MKRQRVPRPVWAIIFAGGEGIHLQDLTRKIEGGSRPKQFSGILGDQSVIA